MADPIHVEQNEDYGPVPNIPAQRRSFYMAFFQMRRPILAGELNHIQQIHRNAIGKMASTFAQPGWAFFSPWSTNWQAIDTGGPQAATSTNLIMTLGRNSALVYDMPVEVGSATGNGDLQIDLGTAPTSGIEKDFVFAEFYNVSVGGFGTSASDQDIFTDGRADGPTEHNDILQSDIVDIETSRRWQTRWRIRVVRDVSFFANENGFNSPLVTAQGDNTTPIANYTFVNLGVTPTEDGPAKRELDGLWRAGVHSDASGNALGTADGYVYALPMFISTRTASVSEPQIEDIRQLTNGNLIGVFEFLEPCTLVVKALPILYYDCAKQVPQARLTNSTSPLNPNLLSDQMQGLFAAKILQSTAPGPLTNGPNDPGIAPLIVDSSTLVENLNASYVQSSAPGSGPGNILLLDNNANAVVGGTTLSLAAESGINGALQSVNLVNKLGDLWLVENGRWDNDLQTWFPQNVNYPSTAISIERLSGKISYNYVDAQQSTLTWAPSFIVDKKNASSTLHTSLSLPEGSLGIGVTSPSHSLDVFGTAMITANATAPALIVNTSASSDGIQVSGQGIGTKAINASSTAGDAVYGAGGTGNAGHFVNGGTGFSLLVEGSKNAFVANSGGHVFVGINKNNPNAELDVSGLVKTSSFQLADNTGPSPGYYLSAVDNTGLAAWAQLPTGPIPAASGVTGYLPRWDEAGTNDLGNSTLYEMPKNSGRFSLGVPGPTNSLTGLSIYTSLLVGSAQSTSIPDSVTGNPTITHPLMSQGAVVFGNVAGSVSQGTEAIFSNKSLPDATYSNAAGLSFMTLGNTRMVITAHGNVAIGIPAMGSKDIDNTTTHATLEVGGSMGIGSAISGNARVDYPYLTIANDPVSNTNNRRVGIQFTKGNTRTFSLGVDTSLTTGLPGDNQNFYIKDHVANQSTPVTRFIIGSNGNIGMGTGIANTNPIYALQVIGDIGNEGSMHVTGTSAAPSIIINRNNANDKNTSVVFQSYNSITPISPITNFILGTADSSVTGAGAYNSTAMYLQDGTGGTRFSIDNYMRRMTVNSGTLGPATFNIASNDNVVFGTSGLHNGAASTVFTANGGTLPAGSINEMILGSFGVQTIDSGTTHNVSLGIHAYRTTAAGTVDSTVMGIGYNMDDTVNLNGSGLWFYNNGGISIGEAPTPTIHNANVAFNVRGNTNFNGGVSTSGAFTSTSNIMTFGAGSGAIVPDATHPYLRISSATTGGGSFRSGVQFLNNDVEKWAIGNDVGLNGGQNFFIYDAVSNAYRVMVDSRGFVGINQVPSNTFRGELDVFGTAIVNKVGIGTNAYPSDANNGSAAGVMSVTGPSIFTGVSPTPVVMTIGVGSYGVNITTGTVSSPNNFTPLFVNATNTGTSTYAAVIQNTSNGRGLSITAPSGHRALDIISGDANIAGAFTASNLGTFNSDLLVNGGINITGFTASSAPDDYSLQAANNVYLAQNTYIQGFLNVVGLSSFYGRASFAQDIFVRTGANAYFAGNAIVSGLTGTTDLAVAGDAVMQHSMRLLPGGGRLYTMLGEYAGHNISEYIFIDPNNHHTVLLRPKRFTGLTIGNNWYEILGDISPTHVDTGLPMDLAGAGTGAWELVAYPAAPVVVNDITVQQIGLTWLPMGYTASYTSLHGYYSDQGEANRRVLASFWHTDSATSDNPAGGLILFSKDTQELDFFDSTQVGIRIREWDTSGRNNGFSWSQNHPARPKPDHDVFSQGAFVGELWEDYIRREGDDRLDHYDNWLWDRDNDEDWRDGDDEHRNIICDPVDQWLNLSPGAPFPEYTFYTVRPMFVQFNWHVDVAIAAKANVAVDCSWNLHMAHGALTIGGLGAETLGAVQTYGWPLAEGDPGTGQTELVAMHHRFINGTRGVPLASHSTNFYYIPAGVHVLRQRIHLDGPFVRANMTRSFLQMIMWGADQNPPFLSTTISSPSPPPPPPPPPHHEGPPCRKPSPCNDFRAYIVAPDRHGCQFRAPDDWGDDDNWGYDVEWRGYGFHADPDHDTPDHSGIIDCGRVPSCERESVEDEHSFYRCRPRNSCEDGDWGEWDHCERWGFSPFDFVEDILTGH